MVYCHYMKHVMKEDIKAQDFAGPLAPSEKANLLFMVSALDATPLATEAMAKGGRLDSAEF